jgi:hypothetical protein
VKPLARTILVVVCVGLFAAFVAWRSHVSATTKPRTDGLVVDLTTSHSADRTKACLAVPGISETVLAQAGSRPGARLIVLALGDSASAGEPVPLSRDDALPARIALSTGEDVLRRQQAAYLAALYGNCLRAPHPEYSAIYLGVERALESLRSRGCNTGVGCALWVATDGEENAQLALKQRLDGLSTTQSGPIAPLDNAGIDVHFCGLAEISVDSEKRSTSRGRRAAFRGRNAGRVAQVWRSIFTAPNSVYFAPFCPQPTKPEDYMRGSVESANR